MRAIQQVEVTKALLDDPMYGPSVVPHPPIDWFVRGPKGGLYEATGTRTRRTAYDPWDHRRMGIVIDQSEGLRYLRPGSKRHEEAKAELRNERGSSQHNVSPEEAR